MTPAEKWIKHMESIDWHKPYFQQMRRCVHEIARYVGFTESFEYCTKCGERAETDVVSQK